MSEISRDSWLWRTAYFFTLPEHEPKQVWRCWVWMRAAASSIGVIICLMHIAAIISWAFEYPIVALVIASLIVYRAIIYAVLAICFLTYNWFTRWRVRHCTQLSVVN